MRTVKTAIIFSILMIAISAIAQKLPVNKETKLIEYRESTSVERAGAGDLVNRLYFWAQNEFKDQNVTIMRDDTTFKTLTIKGSIPMVKSVFGVNYIHTKRLLKFELKFDTDKKDYTYWINNFEYECVESDRNREENSVSGPLEEFKGPAKRSLYDEIDEVCQNLITSFKAGAEVEMTEEQEKAMDEWLEKQKAEKKAAEEAAKQAAKEAEAAQRQAEKEAAAAAKEEAKAQREAEKEAAEAKREEERAAREAEMEKQKAEREAEMEKQKAEREAEMARQKAEREAAMEQQKAEREAATAKAKADREAAAAKQKENSEAPKDSQEGNGGDK
ncbi:MAG: hypothetical protein R2813_11625 [Flavobacteriales bacterium]